MKKGTKVFLIILGVVIVLGGLIANYGIKISNNEIDLRIAIPAQTDKVDMYYTQLVEILVTKAGVSREYATQNKEFQKSIMEGRYSTGNKSMMWIQEANPEFDASLYKDLMNSIEGLRKGFFVEQSKLRDLAMQHERLIKRFPSKIFVGKRGVIEVQILVNKATKTARETGIESTPDLFN